jgi:uncharacterized protein (TIGR03437 family)
MDSVPIVARPGQPVKLKYRMLGNVDFGRIIHPDQSIVPLTDEGNGVFSAVITAPTPGSHDIYTPILGEVRGYVGPAEKCYNNSIISVIGPDVPAARITKLAPDAQKSDYIVNLAIPSAQLPSLNALDFNFDPTPIAKRFYQLFGDDYDMLNFIIAPGFYENRYHTVVKNTVQGIGLLPMDNSAQFGSKGKLLGYSVFPLFFFFDGADRGAVHEIGHQWITHLTKPPFNFYPHWPISDLAQGIMGYGTGSGTQGLEFPCQLKKSGNSLQSSPAQPTIFADLDLYMMGLLRPQDVGEHYIVTDPNAKALLDPCGATTLGPTQFTTITMQDILSGYGARVPAADGSLLKLKIANILITRDTLADVDTMSLSDFFSRRFETKEQVPVKIGLDRRLGQPMPVASSGRASVSTQISATVLPEIAAGGIISAGNFTAGKVAPGSVLSLFGTNLSSLPATAASGAPLPTTLANVQVMVNGSPAPLFYVSSTQINFQLPFELSTAQELNPQSPGSFFLPLYTVTVRNGDLASNMAYLNSQQDTPVIMTYGNNLAVAQDSKFQTIGTANPAKPGDTIVVYFLGANSLNERVASGAPAPTDHLISVAGPNNVNLGGLGATIVFAGLTPGGVGLFQMNVKVPALAPGTYDFKAVINGMQTNIPKLIVGQ